MGFVVLVLGAAAYGLARTSSVFAVRSVAVTGVTPRVAGQVRAALGGTIGESLLSLDLVRARRLAESVPTVASVSLDRAFPHTLSVAVVPERPVAVVRRGAESWLVSARGRVMRSLPRGARPGLPRIWVTRQVPVELGGTLGGDPAAAVRAVAPLRRTRLPEHVASARATHDELTLVLRSGLEIRLGDGEQLRLKLAVAARVLPALAGSHGYLDVAVPERPVAGENLKSQVEVETQPSTSAPVSG